MKKRLCSLLTACALAAGLCAGLTVPAAASFADVTDTETAEAVAVLTSMGVVDGYSSGVYAPEDTLTRAQFCKMIVLATGRGASVSQNSYRALFDDVASNSWALGYINVACSDGLVAGYGDGTFGPNDGVTVAQAVTIVLRCLGYTTQEVGAFWPEDYLAKAADLGLTDGIETGSEEDLTRGEAARLLYAMLQADTADGTAFVQTIADSTQSDVLLLDNDAESEDGTSGTAAVYQDGSVRWYEQANGLDEDLVGLRGTLLLNASGQAAGFVPDGNAYVRLTPSEVTATAITAAGGERKSQHQCERNANCAACPFHSVFLLSLYGVCPQVLHPYLAVCGVEVQAVLCGVAEKIALVVLHAFGHIDIVYALFAVHHLNQRLLYYLIRNHRILLIINKIAQILF